MLWEQLDPTDQDLLAAVDDAPAGPLRFAAAEGALAELRGRGTFAAEALGRMAVLEASHHVPAQPSMLTHFAWLRQVVDHPELQADESSRLRLHWMLKWAPSMMLDLPQVSLDDVEGAVDDLEQVFRRSGFALRPVLGFRAKVARERADLDAVRRAMTQWVTEPRDQLSDCLACDTAGQGLVWERFDPARAVDAWRPVVEGGQQCTEEPQLAQAHDALLQLGAGDPDAALDRVRAAWQRARHDARNSEAVAYCLLVWTRLGNIDRALPALVERHDWLGQMHAPMDRMVWAGAATLVLDAAEAAGCAPETLGGEPLAERREDWHGIAAELARRFDERNGTRYYTDRLQDWLDLEQVATTPHAPPTTLLPGSAEAPPPASIEEHATALAAELDAYGARVPDLLQAWLRHRQSMLASAGPEDEAHIALLERHAARLADEPAVLLDRAEEAARAADRPAETLRIRAERLSLVGADADRVEQLVGIAEELDARGDHDHAAAVWRTAARHADSPEEGERLCLRAVDSAARHGDRAREGLLLVEAAQLAAAAPDRAADHLSRARPLISEHPQLQLLADETEARVLAASGRYEEALELLERALSAPHDPRLATTARFLLCDLLTDLGRMEDLLGASSTVLADAARLEDPFALALGQRFHGLALLETGRPAEALEMLDAALPVVSAELPHLVGPLRWAHANALTALGEAGPARLSYAAAAAAFEAQERFHEAAHAQLQAGFRAWDTDDLDAAEAHFDASAGFAETVRDPALLVEAARSRAAVRHLSGRVPDLAELDAVLEQVTARVAEWEADRDELDLAAVRAQLLRDGANLLADAGRFEEAEIRMRAAERAWPFTGEEWLLRGERGVFLARAERFEDAEQLLRSALADTDADRDPGVRRRLVQRWAMALDGAGRSEDADRIWQEFQPD